MAAGLEVRVPFCDKALVGYVYNVPWSWKALDGEPKGLLRRAAEGLLPDSVVHRRKSPYPTTADRRYEKDLRERVRHLLDTGSPALDVIDRGGLEVMLDEPAAGMNATEKVLLRELISRIRKDNRTILLIEHDVKLVMGLCDRLTVLDYGKQIAEGTPAEVQKNEKVIEASLGTGAH